MRCYLPPSTPQIKAMMQHVIGNPSSDITSSERVAAAASDCALPSIVFLEAIESREVDGVGSEWLVLHFR